ncbi:MAG: EAL domain-containing protein [Formivibrio sp.]|nr:EAL domain-containing protein [Formivibrio sp.]
MMERQNCLISVPYESHTLTSHFQPIYGLSAQRTVGYEALLRPFTADGSAISPLALLNNQQGDMRLKLDQLCHFLHLNNYHHLSKQDDWLFLNMNPHVFLQARKAPSNNSFGSLLSQLEFPPHRLVIEVLEEAVRDDAEFGSAVAFFREMGCLIALDDFGAGSSNFDRVWKIRPQIVKLDRSLIMQAAKEKRIRRLLPQIVSLLHEAGSMVLVEGVETEDEAYIALDSDVDFAQGYLFGRPQPYLVDRSNAEKVIGDLWTDFDARIKQERKQHHQTLSPYLNAIGYAAVLLSAGRDMEESCRSFLELAQSDFCYLLDHDGRQIGVNFWSAYASPNMDQRLAPLKDTQGARWSRRPYFRRAIEHFGKPQVTRPYLSISSADLCVTVSTSFKLNGSTLVICGDVRIPQRLQD